MCDNKVSNQLDHALGNNVNSCRVGMILPHLIHDFKRVKYKSWHRAIFKVAQSEVIGARSRSQGDYSSNSGYSQVVVVVVLALGHKKNTFKYKYNVYCTNVLYSGPGLPVL